MEFLSLFTGCGGLDLGLERCGFRAVAHCENDRFARAVLEERWPHVPCIPDVREVDESSVGYVELVAGGFPCQDLSVAGRGAGLSGERSGLWHEMARCVRHLRPRYVLVENVPGIFSKMGSRPTESAFGTVVGDLAEAGYVGSWLRLHASDVGAPHGRDRVFIVAALAESELAGVDADTGVHRRSTGAHRGPAQEAVSPRPPLPLAEDALEDRGGAPTDTRRDGQLWQPTGDRTDGGVGVERRDDTHGRAVAATGPHDRHAGEAPADTDGAGRQKQRGAVAVPAQLGPAERGSGEAVADAGGVARPPSGERTGRSGEGEEPTARRGPGEEKLRASRRDSAPADADGEPGEPRSRRGTSGGDPPRTGPAQRNRDGLVGEAEPGQIDWGIYAAAVGRWEGILGRAAPRPTDDRGRLEPEFVEWMLGFPHGWTAVDGIPRTQRLKMLGNSVQVQCAELIGGLIDG